MNAPQNHKILSLLLFSLAALAPGCVEMEDPQDEERLESQAKLNSIATPAPENDLFAGDFGQAIGGNVLDNDLTTGTGFYDPQAVLTSPPRYGTLSGIGALIYDGLTPWGQFDYTPAPGFSGIDTFSYRVLNAGKESRVVTVFIAVGDVQIANASAQNVVLGAASARNRSPVSAGLNFVNAGQYWRLLPDATGRASRIRSLANGASNPSVIETWQPSARGEDVTIYRGNNRVWQDFAFLGDEQGRFLIQSLYTNRYISLLNLNLPNQPAQVGTDTTPGPLASWLFHGPRQAPAPITFADTLSTPQDTNVRGNVLSNDTPTGVDFFALLVTPPKHGSFTGIEASIYGGIAPWGTFSYQPEPGFVGVDTFTYMALTSSNGAPSAVTQVSVTVGP